MIIFGSILGSVLIVGFIWKKPDLEISYTDLISISLTAVTVILAATAITVGLIGFYTISDLKSDARKAVEEEYDKVENKLTKIIEQKINSLEQKITGDIGGLNELNQSDNEDR